MYAVKYLIHKSIVLTLTSQHTTSSGIRRHELQMSGVPRSETFSLTWKLENAHLSNLGINSFIETPVFRVGILQNTSWQMVLAPGRINDPFWKCSLKRRGFNNEPKIVNIRWRICVIAEGGAVRFEKYIDSIFPNCKTEEVPDFIRKSELLPTDTPQNNLTIFCEMTSDPQFILKTDSKYDCEALSSDLAGLLESGFRSDFIMYCRGEIYKVHKFILLSRWPQFCKRLEIDDISTKDDIIMTGVDSSTLYTFLTFLYTGRLRRQDITMELCTFMFYQLCDTLMEKWNTPVSNLEFITHMHYEWKHLVWEVGDDNTWQTTKLPFYRVIPLEEVYMNEMVVVFNFVKRNSEEWLKLSLSFIGFSEMKPVLLDGEISFVNKKLVVSSRKFKHLLESGEELILPYFVKRSDLFPNESNSKCIEISLHLSDGPQDTRQVSSTISNASRFHEVKDLSKLRMDLSRSTYKKDLTLKIGKYIYRVHSPIIAARSEKFRELIQQNDDTIEIDEEGIGKMAANCLIRHLYGGCLPKLEIDSIIRLHEVAKKYLLTSLEERTRKILEIMF